MARTKPNGRCGIREIAQRSGVPISSTHRLLAAGLLPGYLDDRDRFRGAVSREAAEMLVPVLSSGAVSLRLAAQMKENPAQVLAWAESLARLANAALEASARPKVAAA